MDRKRKADRILAGSTLSLSLEYTPNGEFTAYVSGFFRVRLCQI